MIRSAVSEIDAFEARHAVLRIAFACVVAAASAHAAAAVDCVFSQSSPFALGTASTSSRLAVSGVTGAVTKVVVTLTDAGAPGLTGGGLSDVDLLLVGPGGQKILLASYACPAEYSLLDLVFDKSASGELPDGEPESADCASGTYLPSDHSAVIGGYLLASPAPPSPYSENLATLEGVDPAGMWKLWGAAFKAANEGQVASWELRLTATSCGAPTLVFADDFEAGVCGWSLESGESPACP